jgi:DNA processing protein
MDAEPAYWLALNRLPALGQAELCALVEGRASPNDFVAAYGRRVTPGSHRRTAPDWRAVEADLNWLATPGRHLLTLSMPAYPPRLRHIPDPPPVLFVEGDAEILSAVQLAMVGSRRPTPCGVETAHCFSFELAGCGLAITSGLALGIDAASHRGAMAGRGRTVAVAANGLDTVYPRIHRRLARQVAENGALVSEFSPGSAPLARHFPRRNRLISGLSLGVVVVEAARRSGSLITARLAGEQGREVFAVPGPIQSPLARGCHHLIRQGAKLVEQVSDILEELPTDIPGGRWQVPGKPASEAADRFADDLDGSQKKVLASLAHRATSVDSVVERSGLTADTVSSILLALELRGLVVPLPGGAYCRVTKSPQKRLSKRL